MLRSLASVVVLFASALAGLTDLAPSTGGLIARAEAQVIGLPPGPPPSAPAVERLFPFGRQLYRASFSLRLEIPGTPPPTGPVGRLVATLAIEPLGDGNVGPLPDSFRTVIRQGNQWRIVTLNRIIPGPNAPVTRAAIYTASTTPLTNPNPGFTFATVEYRDGRFHRRIIFAPLTVGVMAFP
jgi:hypothetical protein